MPRRSTLDRSANPVARSLDTLRIVVIGAVVAGSALAMAGAPPAWFAPWGTLAIIVALLELARLDARDRPHLGPIAFALGLSSYCVLQALPLPLDWVRTLNPNAADLWARCLTPEGGGVRFASLSLDPTASRYEAFKWASYAAVFLLCAIEARRGSERRILLLVLGTAVAVAAVTFVHNLAGLTEVYGIYTPRHPVPPGRLGPFLNGNNLSGYLNLAACIAAGLLWSRRPTVPRSVLGAILVVLVGFSLRTASRGGIVALVVSLSALALWTLGVLRERVAAARVVLGGGLAFLVVGAVLAWLGADATFWSDLTSENTAKLQMPRWVWPMIREYPAFGVGRGAFESVFFAYRPPTAMNIAFTHPENLVLQWASEWGLVVALLALAAFARWFSPMRLRATKSALAAGGLAGVFALVLQNLVDLSLELPGPSVAVAAVLGGLWGDARSFERSRPAGRARRLAPLALALGLVVGFSAGAHVALSGGHLVALDRARVREALESRARDPEALAATRSLVRGALLAHPADYFFPLAEAALAERDGRNPFPWLNRALERGPTVARTHLLLAEVLRVRGADSQALLALSLAAQYEPPLASIVPRVALAITRDPNELVRAAPPGPVGAKVLAELGAAMTDPADANARARLDALALARNERLVPPRLRLLERTLDDLARPGGCADRDACEGEVRAHADALAAFAPRSTHAARARGRLAMLRDDVAGAVETLESGCQSPDDRGPCLELLIQALDRAGRTDDVDRRLDEYVSVACARRSTCAEGHAWAARWLLAKGQAQRAVTELERAARVDPIEARWLAVAEAAERAGLRPATLDALEQVVSLGGGAATEARARLAKLRGPR